MIMLFLILDAAVIYLAQILCLVCGVISRSKETDEEGRPLTKITIKKTLTTKTIDLLLHLCMLMVLIRFMGEFWLAIK